MHIYLRRYLLGMLPEEEIRLVDGARRANKTFEALVRGAENDLVDAYARGDLAGEALERFESYYLSSLERRAKVRFARLLQSIIECKSSTSG